ncbi:hypothetical protein B0H34DRAFT_800944 [Crassisporium funariophilum]|nr:hypothetical protein B0H34DRAFT_800944 [Crassisporium funariophilum]
MPTRQQNPLYIANFIQPSANIAGLFALDPPLDQNLDHLNAFQQNSIPTQHLQIASRNHWDTFYGDQDSEINNTNGDTLSMELDFELSLFEMGTDPDKGNSYPTVSIMEPNFNLWESVYGSNWVKVLRLKLSIFLKTQPHIYAGLQPCSI